MGVILFAMAFAELPFNMDLRRPRQTLHKICRGEYRFPGHPPIKGDIKHLIKW